jgi:taurine dioxygenase
MVASRLRSVKTSKREEAAMVRFEKRGDSFAVTACGVDLSKPLSDADFADVLRGIGTHGVVCFPDQ